MSTQTNIVFYRYEAVQYAVSNDEDHISPILPNPQLQLREYNLFKETLKGYWIGYGSFGPNMYSWKKWVSKTAKKRFAYPTQKEALVAYIKRTERRCSILKAQLSSCNIVLLLAKTKLNQDER